MTDGEGRNDKRVRHFRQILLWPLQLMPIREGSQIQRHWEVLEHGGDDNPWHEVVDEFTGDHASSSRNATTTSSSPSCRTCNAFSTAKRGLATQDA